MSHVDGPAEDHPPLSLPVPPGFKLTSGSFEIPQTEVRINLKPELVGEYLTLLAEAVEIGADSAWFRSTIEGAASMVVETGSGREYLDAFVELADLAHRHELLSPADLQDIRPWAETAQGPERLPTMASVEQRKRWDEARAVLQSWLDSQSLAPKKKALRQRSIARVTCGECNSLLAWLVPQSDLEFIVLARGDNQAFEVAHALGEYGGYARTRCGRRRGGRTWVMHADHLRQWLDRGIADVVLRHADKGL